MPFCNKCGKQVSSADVYCASCGVRQATVPTPASDPLGGISARTASLACYIPLIGWLAAVAVLAAPRFERNRDVRFHAFQGLYLFVVWLIVDWVVEPMLIGFPGPRPHLGNVMKHLVQLAVFGAWIVMIIKTSQDQMYRLPIIGEMAERSLAEQR